MVVLLLTLGGYFTYCTVRQVYSSPRMAVLLVIQGGTLKYGTLSDLKLTYHGSIICNTGWLFPYGLF